VTDVAESDERAEVMIAVNERDTLAALEEAIERVRGAVRAACERSGRLPEQVRLIGVTKGVTAEIVALAARAGLDEFGENYVQELVSKRAAAREATWHYIGRLQRNKVQRVLESADVVQTLERSPATERLIRLAEDRPVDCLIEVDFAGGRVGAAPAEVEALAEELQGTGARLRGLMTVAPQQEDPRRSFSALRELRDRLAGRFDGTGELSMGMSADLEAAVEEGATMVRVGTAIFGPRARR
jgi:pyridoxal phosphate enzyme (YggS family)